ncbi:NAD(P)/FAD-dependent oxidoreductase [Aerococcus sp. 1KP-2016]|uniref:NAD(P)/FAD-dependent oxidoreductase n=1 Tax=Aerococcus sp. 1KP-2016 TaxID=1981982 RepID=UPI000B991179|nr:NAD(P)/FAD-dependent oxidoreductase [Aerococcus sp. 1KP-2016]OYQ66882.1 FAD-dependent oxidoreductase [Aerococcus sp. 1KP-2016]
MNEVVILGAGYAGLRALKKLQGNNGDFHITLVDKNPYHFEATDLHEVAAGTQPREKITYEIEAVVDPKKTTFKQAEVAKIDRANSEVIFTDGSSLHYDYVIVALGFESESFGIEGVEEFAMEMVSVDAAENINKHIHAKMAEYRTTQDPNALKIVVCGAGFTGVELLGALVEGRDEFAEEAGVSADGIQIYCIEAVTRLLPMFDEKLSEWGINHLKNWGVQLLTGKPIKAIKGGAVVYQDNAETGETAELEAGTIIWTTGVSGSHVITDSGYEARRNRVSVNADLRDPEYDNVYVIGDVSAVMDPETNRPWPTTAQIATKMGEFAAKNLVKQMNGQPTEDFTFKSLGSVASIGNTHAFGLVFDKPVKGYPASFIKKSIMDKSLLETGGVKQMLSKGRWDLYH